MSTFTVSTRDDGEISIISVSGYLNAEGGKLLWSAVETLLQKGRHRVVINFSSCTGINSPGAGGMIEIAILLTEDFRGTLVLCGLDELKRKVFALAGILSNVAAVASEEDAIRLAAS